MSDWISVKDRLPETHGEYLVFTAHDFVTAMYYRPTANKKWEWNWRSPTAEPITHWMPLPEPPAEGGVSHDPDTCIDNLRAIIDRQATALRRDRDHHARLCDQVTDLRATVERQAGEIERLNRREENNLKFAEAQAAEIATLRAAKEAAEAERDRFSDCWQQREHDCFILQTERDALRARIAELEGYHDAK